MRSKCNLFKFVDFSFSGTSGCHPLHSPLQLSRQPGGVQAWTSAYCWECGGSEATHSGTNDAQTDSDAAENKCNCLYEKQ